MNQRKAKEIKRIAKDAGMDKAGYRKLKRIYTQTPNNQKEMRMNFMHNAALLSKIQQTKE